PPSYRRLEGASVAEPVGEPRRLGELVAHGEAEGQRRRVVERDPVADGDVDGLDPLARAEGPADDLPAVDEVGRAPLRLPQRAVAPHEDRLRHAERRAVEEHAEVAREAEPAWMRPPLRV